MFFLHDHVGKATAIYVHPRFFVTFRHGTHFQFKIGDALKIYTANEEVNEQVGNDVCVVKVNELLDFVLLKSKSDVIEHGPPIAKAQESEPFTLAGYGNTQQSLSYLPGVIHSVHDLYGTSEENSMGSFILDTSSGGGGIWSSHELI